jgi:hypothetical protein
VTGYRGDSQLVALHLEKQVGAGLQPFWVQVGVGQKG